MKAAVDELLAKHADENRNADVYKFCFNCIDLTTLNSTDSPRSVAEFTERVNAFDEEHPELPPVAGICVYPNFAQVVRTVLDVSRVDVVCVSGGFPTSQTFIEAKIAETALAIDGGATKSTLCSTLAISSMATMRKCVTKSPSRKPLAAMPSSKLSLKPARCAQPPISRPHPCSHFSPEPIS